MRHPIITYEPGYTGRASIDRAFANAGLTPHLTMEAMKTALGLDLTHVPFKGSGQSVPALIGGQVAAEAEFMAMIADPPA